HISGYGFDRGSRTSGSQRGVDPVAGQVQTSQKNSGSRSPAWPLQGLPDRWPPDHGNLAFYLGERLPAPSTTAEVTLDQQSTLVGQRALPIGRKVGAKPGTGRRSLKASPNPILGRGDLLGSHRLFPQVLQ